jgi:hypothetical protein
MRPFKAAAEFAYRAYVMDHRGHIQDVRVIPAEHDREALRIAARLGLGARFELWCGSREVSSYGQGATIRQSHGDPLALNDSIAFAS